MQRECGMNKTTQIKVLESSNLVNCLFSLKFAHLAYKPLHDAASASLTTIILNKTPCSLYFLNLFFIVNSIIEIPHFPSSLVPSTHPYLHHRPLTTLPFFPVSQTLTSFSLLQATGLPSLYSVLPAPYLHSYFFFPYVSCLILWVTFSMSYPQ